VATAAERYQLYLSSVGNEARAFLTSLDGQPEDDIRAMIDRKQFGRRAHLALIWLDYQSKIREETADQDALQRINRGIDVARSGRARDSGPPAAKPTLMSRLRNMLRG
jgi:hypothetical protein